MNGKERLWWAEDFSGYVYLTTEFSPLKKGFQRFSTVTPSEMDRIFAKLDKQEQATYAKMTEDIYVKRRDWIDENRSNLRERIAQSNSLKERDFLKAWLKAFDNKMDKLMKGTVHGISAMQKSPAPLPVERPMRTVDDIRLGEINLKDMKAATEVLQ